MASPFFCDPDFREFILGCVKNRDLPRLFAKIFYFESKFCVYFYPNLFPELLQ